MIENIQDFNLSGNLLKLNVNHMVVLSMTRNINIQSKFVYSISEKWALRQKGALQGEGGGVKEKDGELSLIHI